MSSLAARKISAI